ncbi:DUF6318 family protein [Actinomyces howellii]|nr:DUF6318 family protein [Actinomyces howellii]
MRIARCRRLVSALVCALVLVAAAGVGGCSDSGADSASPAPTARSTASSPTASSSAASSTATAPSTPAAGSSGQASAEASESGTPSQVPSLSAEEQASRDAALATPEPSRPVGMDEQSPAGAAATASYFLNLFPYAFATGDLTTWKEMSEDDCIFCNSVIDDVDALHNSGGWSDMWTQEVFILSYGADPADPNRLVVTLHLTAPEHVAHRGRPSEAFTVDAQDVTIKIQLYWHGDRWIVEEGEIIEGGEGR